MVRTSFKVVILISISTFLIIGMISFLYRPTYSVSFQGEFIGYTKDKTKLQNRINEYMNVGEGQNVAFVQIDNLPDYTLCMLKNNIEANDEEIFEKVKSTGLTYYKYYAILNESEEKFYVSSVEDAEATIEKLKEKNSSNKDKIGFIEKFETEIKEFAAIDTIVDSLYVMPVVKRTVSTGISTSANLSGPSVELGISLSRPVSGMISSRFGGRGSGTHTGLDIATSRGTTITAAASGTVTHAEYTGSYGNLIKISHGNGVETYYAHCDSLKVSVGDYVSPGTTIGTVGSTGNSTGPHLHFEVRVNGVAQNPQNYVY